MPIGVMKTGFREMKDCVVGTLHRRSRQRGSTRLFSTHDRGTPRRQGGCLPAIHTKKSILLAIPSTLHGCKQGRLKAIAHLSARCTKAVSRAAAPTAQTWETRRRSHDGLSGSSSVRICTPRRPMRFRYEAKVVFLFRILELRGGVIRRPLLWRCLRYLQVESTGHHQASCPRRL